MTDPQHPDDPQVPADDAGAPEEVAASSGPDEETLAAIRELQARVAQAEAAAKPQDNSAVGRLREALAATPRSVKLLLVGVSVFGTLTLSGLRCGSEGQSKVEQAPPGLIAPR